MRGNGLLIRFVAAVVALAALASPAAFGAGSEDVEGTIDFSGATLTGETVVTTSAFEAASLTPTTQNLRMHWNLQASSMVVNWTRVTSTNAGFSPTDPESGLVDVTDEEAESGERWFGPSGAASSVDALDANLLIRPLAGREARMECTSSRMLVAEPSEGRDWSAGYFSNRSVGLSDARPVTVTYTTTEGAPLFAAEGPLLWTIRGDFSLYMWGSNVSVEDGIEPKSYRSGAWYENSTGSQTGPRGVARTEYWQLLRLDVTDGALVLLHDQGEAGWTAPEARVETVGSATFEESRGTLESAETIFELDGATLTIEGDILQTFRASEDAPGSLSSYVNARGASLRGASLTMPNPHVASSAILIVSLPLLGLAAIIGAFYGVRQYQTRSWNYNLRKAEQALGERRFEDAVKHTSRLIDRRAASTAAATDALFLHAAARIEAGDPDWILRELPRRMLELGSPPTLAYLVALAAAQVGDVANTKKWMDAIRHDPQLVADFLVDPRIAHRRSQLVAMAKTDTAYN